MLRAGVKVEISLNKSNLFVLLWCEPPQASEPNKIRFPETEVTYPLLLQREPVPGVGNSRKRVY